MSRERTVTLHVYDFVGVGSRTSAFLSSMRLGLHHSGVEVSGQEYTFNDGGVFKAPPLSCSRGEAPQCVLVESVVVGVHSGSLNDFNGVVNAMRRDFPPGAYALTTRNCNHFADAFCKALVGRGIPAYVNRMAGYGRWLGVGFLRHYRAARMSERCCARCRGGFSCPESALSAKLCNEQLRRLAAFFHC